MQLTIGELVLVACLFIALPIMTASPFKTCSISLDNVAFASEILVITTDFASISCDRLIV